MTKQRVTIKMINQALCRAGLPTEIVKGNGYFWFDVVESAPYWVDFSSIYVNRVNDLTVDMVVSHVRDELDELRKQYR